MSIEATRAGFEDSFEEAFRPWLWQRIFDSSNS